MVTKEIKQFVISQMKEADWDLEFLNNSNEYKSKHINIQHDTTISQKVTFSIKIPSGYENLKLSRKELGINYFYFRWLLGSVKKSCSLVDKCKREQEISRNWKKFLERNKDLRRDNRINQVLD
jgi:hypothetical protein